MSDTKTLAQVGAEMSRQIAKWGQQNHNSYTPDGVITTQYPLYMIEADLAKSYCDDKARNGTVSWFDIFMEEVFEASDEAQAGDLQKLRTELIQVAAVACSWVESIDRNGK